MRNSWSFSPKSVSLSQRPFLVGVASQWRDQTSQDPTHQASRNIPALRVRSIWYHGSTESTWYPRDGAYE